jgi:N-acetylneuraminate synthase
VAWQALGKVNYKRKESEKGNLIFRRSLYCIKDIKAGELFTSENIKSIRPGYGLPPKYLNLILGKKVRCDIHRGSPLTKDKIVGFTEQ